MRILVVENYAAVRNLVKKCLKEAFRNLEIVEAIDGEEAKNILLKDCFELIICGLEIPRIRGDELLLWIRNKPALYYTPFILMSPKDDKDIIQRVMQKGATAYLVKPFSANDLVRKVISIENELERRQHKRSTMEGDVVFKYNSHTAMGKLKDISLGGICGLISVAKIEEGYPQILQKVKIELHLKSGQLVNEIEGYVVRLEPMELSIDSEKIILAVKFIDLRNEKREELSNLF